MRQDDDNHANASPSIGDDADTGKQLRFVMLLADIASDLLAANDPSQMITRLFDKIQEALKLDVFFNYRLKSDDILYLEESSGLTAQQLADGSQLALGQAVCGVVARDRRPIVATGILQSEDPLLTFVKNIGIDSYACTPLLDGQTLLGTLGFGRCNTDPFDEDDLRFIRTICSYVALAKQRLAMEQKLRLALETSENLRHERSRLHAEVIQLSRLNAMSAVSATLAHELNQPLAAATNYLAAAEHIQAGSPDNRATMLLHAASDQILRAGEIVKRIRKMVAEQGSHIEPASTKMLIDEAVKLSRTMPSADGAAIVTSIADDAHQLHCDRIQIAQVLGNLLRNAREATQLQPAPLITLSAARLDSATIVISVTDNGPGIPPDIRNELFEPFAPSSKNGLGLGLSICRSIVETYGGRIWAEHPPGGGARFCFTVMAGLIDETHIENTPSISPEA